jgi:hypothetical protein
MDSGKFSGFFTIDANVVDAADDRNETQKQNNVIKM